MAHRPLAIAIVVSTVLLVALGITGAVRGSDNVEALTVDEQAALEEVGYCGSFDASRIAVALRGEAINGVSMPWWNSEYPDNVLDTRKAVTCVNTLWTIRNGRLVERFLSIHDQITDPNPQQPGADGKPSIKSSQYILRSPALTPDCKRLFIETDSGETESDYYYRSCGSRRAQSVPIKWSTSSTEIVALTTDGASGKAQVYRIELLDDEAIRTWTACSLDSRLGISKAIFSGFIGRQQSPESAPGAIVLRPRGPQTDSFSFATRHYIVRGPCRYVSTTANADE